MIKASALYLVIVISFMLTLILSSIIAAAFYFRLRSQQDIRYVRLAANLHSAVALVTSSDFKEDSLGTGLDLFDRGADSIWVAKNAWGVFDLAAVKSFQQRDTLQRVFLLGRKPNAGQVLYLADENRPLSVSGDTRITGEALLPKSGIRQAYVEGRPFSGKNPVEGRIRESKPELPPLQAEMLKRVERLFLLKGNKFTGRDSVLNSFFQDARVLQFDKDRPFPRGFSAQGRLILVSDTVLHVDRDARLENVILIAPAVVIEGGFRGSAQFFVKDSLVTGAGCVFDYPSAFVLYKDTERLPQPKLELGRNSVFNGLLVSYEKKHSELQTLISLGKGSLVRGEVYATGFLKMEKPLEVDGQLTCRRFLIQTPSTLYENYLLDVVLNRRKLSAFYLSSALLAPDGSTGIAKWLN
ncbi:hypothetical protein GS399_05310 [Pedobacter sp. HMF7647]|uniref:Uncharacterized protein n=1 Tax=Hufsiella arboris TaxID=2695275 RepID=A0A7K1Y736_9SPHI|nr:hypothetical protein [Hufsiella arboris]MXV50383.1 hypothetical protein [Hufsiella arboris]